MRASEEEGGGGGGCCSKGGVSQGKDKKERRLNVMGGRGGVTARERFRTGEIRKGGD